MFACVAAAAVVRDSRCNVAVADGNNHTNRRYYLRHDYAPSFVELGVVETWMTGKVPSACETDGETAGYH